MCLGNIWPWGLGTCHSSLPPHSCWTTAHHSGVLRPWCPRAAAQHPLRLDITDLSWNHCWPSGQAMETQGFWGQDWGFVTVVLATSATPQQYQWPLWGKGAPCNQSTNPCKPVFLAVLRKDPHGQNLSRKVPATTAVPSTVLFPGSPGAGPVAAACPLAWCCFYY